MSHQSLHETKIYLTRMYYSRHYDSLLLPENIGNREFAFQLYGSKSYIRHLSFSNDEFLREWLIKKAPHSAFYSSAIYEIPDAPKMNEKGWLGSELQVDIDIDHLEECSQKIIINPCGNENTLFEEECLYEGYLKALETAHIFKTDFGLENVFIHFSGNRGFHVYVTDEQILSLTSEERREITDYLQGNGLDLSLITPRRRGVSPHIPHPDDPGWRGRLARKALSIYNKSSTEEPFEKFFWNNIETIIKEASLPIDAQVTIDISRLVRIPGSINGKSGLLVSNIESRKESLTFSDFSPFKGSLKIRPICDIDITFGGSRFSFKKGVVYRVESSLGIYLVFKDLAKIIDLGDTYV